MTGVGYTHSGTYRPALTMQTGLYYPAVLGVPTLTNAFTLNRLAVTRFEVERATSFDRIGLEVTSGVATALARFVVYAASNGYPGALLLDGGTNDSSVTGWVEDTIALTLAPGNYFVGVVQQTAASTLRCRGAASGLGPNARGIGFATSAAIIAGASQALSYTLDSVSGAPPDPFTAGATTRSIMPDIWLRAA